MGKPRLKPITLPPDPDGENDNRAGWANEAIATFQTETECEDSDVLVDLLCDLRHWADREGRDWEAEFDRAMRMYAEETKGGTDHV